MEARRRLLMQSAGILPTAYRAVSYIENTGTQYLKTNYIVQADFAVITLTFMHRNAQTGDSMYFGAFADSTKKTYQCEIYNNHGWYVACGKFRYTNALYDVGAALNTLYYLSVNDSELEVDGQTSSPVSTTRTNPMTLPMYIFAWNHNGIAEYINKGARIYSLSFREGGQITADFMPCVRKSDNKPGMYDTVSKTFYTNAGTGEFIVPA